MFGNPLPRRIGVLAVASAVLLSVAAAPPAEALTPADVPAIGVDTGRFDLPISCAITLPEVGGLKVFDLATNVDVRGVVAISLGPGQQFYLSQGSGAITFPTWLTGLAGTVGLFGQFRRPGDGAEPEGPRCDSGSPERRVGHGDPADALDPRQGHRLAAADERDVVGGPVPPRGGSDQRGGVVGFRSGDDQVQRQRGRTADHVWRAIAGGLPGGEPGDLMSS
jgi:hypothetical protein